MRTVAHRVQPYVNDGLRVASNADRIDRDADGVFYGDIKTARHAHKVDYLVQLATIAGALPYDLEGDCRGEWAGTPSHTRAAIYHFPVAEAVGKPRDEWPDWSLIWVDITTGVELNERLRRPLRERQTSRTEAFHPLVHTRVETSRSSRPSPSGGRAARRGRRNARHCGVAPVDPRGVAGGVRGVGHRQAGGLPGATPFEQWHHQADATEAERLECYKGFHAEYAFTDVTSPFRKRAQPRSSPYGPRCGTCPPTRGRTPPTTPTRR
jgi:hypothetical protein